MKKYDWLTTVIPVFIFFIAGIAVVTYFASKKVDKEIIDYEKKVQPSYTAAAEEKNIDSTLQDLAVNGQGQLQTEEQEYFLVYGEDKICIYQGVDRIFYDYAEVRLEELPGEIKNQLYSGLLIKGEQALYEFLQTYSS